MLLNVLGMTCQHCIDTVTTALQRHDAGAGVEVDLAAGTVRIEGRLRREDAVAAIEAEGYVVAYAAPAACCAGRR